jgi:hypothetical protein
MKYFSKVFFLVYIFVLSAALAFAQETGGVKGKVRTTENDPLAQVTVTAQRDGKDIKMTTTNANGEFVLDGLQTGNYNIAFTRNGYNSGVRYNVEVKKKKIRDLGGRLVLTVDQGTQVIIKGTVFDEAGRSVRGANIEIEEKQSDGSYRKISSTTSSYGLESLARGEFMFSFPPADSAEFRVTASIKGVSASKVVNVSGAAIYRLALNLKVSISDNSEQ